jgi:osmotically-inducible protein OsmY
MKSFRQIALIPRPYTSFGLALVFLAVCFAALSCGSTPDPGPSDAQLKRDITTALDGAGLKTVMVQVKDGVAMLSGTAPDQASIDNAIQISRGVNGVKDVTSQVTLAEIVAPVPPAPPEPTTQDDKLAAGLRFALYSSPALAQSKIDIKVLSGTAILTGSVRNDAARTEAAKIATGYPGILAVENRLEVVEAPLVNVPDDKLEERVQQVLDKSFSDLDLTMTVKKGMVVVRGAVRDRSQMLQIGEAIRAIDGVRGIDTSLLTVEGGEEGERIGSKSPPAN